MCSLTPAATLTVPTHPSAAGRAREFLLEAACHPHQARVLESAQLLVSELVTNAVVHGSPPITVRLECVGGEELSVAVTDQASVDELTPGSADAEDEGGRGLTLVDIISDSWGVDPHPEDDGKVVWFRIRS